MALLCSDQWTVVKGNWLTRFFPHPLLLVRHQAARSWINHGLFFLQLPWLTQKWWWPCLLKTNSQCFGSPTKEALRHVLQVCETSHTACLKMKHKLTTSSLHCWEGLALFCLEEPLSLHLLPVISYEHHFPVLSFSCLFLSPSHTVCLTAQLYYLMLSTICEALCVMQWYMRLWGSNIIPQFEYTCSSLDWLQPPEVTMVWYPVRGSCKIFITLGSWSWKDSDGYLW